MLKNWKREQGALALYAGKSDREAMEAAGLKYSPANGRRFRNSPDVRARLKELFEADRPYHVLEALRARREREHVAYARISNYFEDGVDDKGQPTGERRFKGFAKLSDAEVAAIKSIKETKLGTVIELFEKDAALRAIEARVDPPASRSKADDVDEGDAPAAQVASWDDGPAAGVRPN
jgi:hypothetical protein